MISAFLKGKLSSSEDILTSCVFDVLRYAPSNQILIEWLRLSETPDSERLLKCLSNDAEIISEYWPPLSEDGCSFCEPDILLHIDDHPARYTVLIEAKYESGKSSTAGDSSIPTDQLAKEWDNLVVFAKRERTTPILIYLTASVGMPRKEIEDSKFEFRKKRNSNKFDICWLSWRHLSLLLRNQSFKPASDLCDLLNHLDLYMFDGIQMPKNEGVTWEFDGLSSPMWVVNPKLKKISWRFKNVD